MTEPAIALTGELEDRDSWRATNCAIARTMDLVSSRSAFLILREAFYGSTRFDEFARRVGISESIAAARLRDLVEAGLLERRPYQEPGTRTRSDYHLTEAGRDFFPVLLSMWQWGEQHLGPSGVDMVHHGCGAEIQTEIHCHQGHSVQLGEIDIVVAG